MKKGSSSGDELRAEYKRSDFGELVRGKYVERLKRGSSVVVLDPRIARAFPTSGAVNAALLSLLDLARSPRARRWRAGHLKAWKPPRSRRRLPIVLHAAANAMEDGEDQL